VTLVKSYIPNEAPPPSTVAPTVLRLPSEILGEPPPCPLLLRPLSAAGSEGQRVTNRPVIDGPLHLDLADLDCLEAIGLRRVGRSDVFAEIQRDIAAGVAPPPNPAKPRRARRPSIRKQIAAAERGGKTVTSITTPDGVTLRFGEGEAATEANNPWPLDDFKVTKQ
jgi:hypothetical protein